MAVEPNNLPNSNDVKFHLHLQESEDMKRQWFSYVYENMKTLHDKVEASVLQAEKEKSYAIQKLVRLKEQITEDIKKNSESQRKDLEKLECRLDKLIDNITTKLDCVNASKIRLEIDECVQSTKTECDLSFEEFKESTDKKIQVLINEQIVVRTKLLLYTVMMSLATTTIATAVAGGILAMFSEGIKKWWIGL